VWYGKVEAVKGISFDVAAGEFLTLLGPSGCGKTTTLRCIAGLERNQAGTIMIAGKPVSDPAAGLFVPPNLRDIGMVFQSYAIWPHMTVFKNVAYPLECRGASGREIRQKVENVLELVGLAELADRAAPRLSGGQQQRVALARALVADPHLLLLDEPLSNLDAKLRDRTRFELRRLQQRLNLSAVYVTHDQAEAMAVSDRIIVMSRGEIRQIGRPREIYEHPADPFVADFIGSTNLLEVTFSGERDGTYARVALADGSTLRVPGADCAGPGLVSIRPNAITLLPGDASASDDGNRLRGTVDRLAYLGERVEYWISGPGGDFRVYADPSVAYAAGDRVTMTFEPDACIPIRGDT